MSLIKVIIEIDINNDGDNSKYNNIIIALIVVVMIM